MKCKKWRTKLLPLVTSFLILSRGMNLNPVVVEASESSLSVVTTFYPVYEFTKAVAADRVDVSLMVTGAADPHGYEPSAQNVVAVNEADLFVYSSESMEYWVEALLNNVDNENLVVVRTADSVDAGQLTSEDVEEEHTQDVADEIMINGLKEHYHTGDTVNLTAELAEAVKHAHWHWYERTDDTQEWMAISGQGTDTLEYTVSEESFEIQAVLYDNQHNAYAESDPIQVNVDNHEAEGHNHSQDEAEEDHNHSQDEAQAEHNITDATEGVEVVGLAEHYHTGDVITLRAHSDKEVSSWQWSIRLVGQQEWKIIPDQTSDIFEDEAAEQSFEVQAEAVNQEGHTIAASAPVSAHVDNHETLDPHIWLDPVLAKEQVNIIRDALIQIDPEGDEIYTANAAVFNEELQMLHEEFQAAFEGAENRSFIVQHQAFGYLAQRYDLEQIAIGGLSTEVEPSPARMVEIAKIVKDTGATVIYYQQGANSSIAQTVASETGVEVAVLFDLEAFSQELQANELGYLEAMRKNLDSLKLSIK